MAWIDTISDYMARVILAVAVVGALVLGGQSCASTMLADTPPFKPFDQAQRQPLTDAEQVEADETARDAGCPGMRGC